MSYRKGYYKKDGTYVQGHYVSSRGKSRSTKNKNSKGCASIMLIIMLLVFFISCTEEDTGCESKKCSNFSTQSEAQITFDSNRSCYQSLDTDNDGIPCENLPK